jgi:undecaprenyl-diphosphatase
MRTDGTRVFGTNTHHSFIPASNTKLFIGAMALGFSRRAATEFSFFLAIPMLFGAAAYDLYRHRALLSLDDLPFFTVGLVVSWLSAWVCVKWLMRYVTSHTFVPFAWYRIGFGTLVLVTAWGGWVNWTP